MKRAIVPVVVAVGLLGYLRLLVTHPEANPFELVRFWKNHAYVVNHVVLVRHALEEYRTAQGEYPSSTAVALDAWLARHSVEPERIAAPPRGELYYWTDGNTFVLSWQDARIRSMHSTIAYCPDKAYFDQNALAEGLLNGECMEQER